MTYEFKLTPLPSTRDPITNRFTFTESFEFKFWIAVAALCLISISVVDLLGLELAEWQQMVLIAGMVIAYGFAFIGIFFRRGAGKAEISQNVIRLFPMKNKDLFPESPIKLKPESEIEINILQKLTWFFPKIILGFSVSKNSQPSEFGLILDSRKSKKQYLEVLEGWYRQGYSVKEFDRSGSRIFKLDRGKTYADIKKIKSEYGIYW